MELPHHYLPPRICPYRDDAVLKFATNKKRCMKFADYGSHFNVDADVSEEQKTIKFIPQYGQRGIAGLSSSISSLPLFDKPLLDQISLRDNILGLKSYARTVKDMKYIVSVIPSYRYHIQQKKSLASKKFRICKNILDKKLHSDKGEPAISDDKVTAKLMKFLEGLPKDCFEKYSNIREAHNDNCLKGYNADFYGGLLCHWYSQDLSKDILVHAGGTGLRDLYMTEVSFDKRFKTCLGKVLSKVSMDEPLFQICCAADSGYNGLVCVRKKHACQILKAETKGREFVWKGTMDLHEETLSSIAFSPYISDEILISTQGGIAYLWDVNSRHKQQAVKTPKFDCPDKWACSYFGGHPRQIVLADRTSVDMFDHRSRFSSGVEVFGLDEKYVKQYERVMAAFPLGFPYHGVVTDHAVFVMDQRFSSTPILQWSHELVLHSPQYVQVLNSFSSNKEGEEAINKNMILAVASQQPAEVMCFPFNVSNSQTPTTSILPFRVSRIWEFTQCEESSSLCNQKLVENRFETSLAGFTISHLPLDENNFIVYQMDGYGDIFYQPYLFTNSSRHIAMDNRTKEDRTVALNRGRNWLKALETSATDKYFQSPDKQGVRCSSIDMGTGALTSLFSMSEHMNSRFEEAKEPPSDCMECQIPMSLKLWELLPHKGSSAQLHLALRDGKDLKDLLEKREADHIALKKMMRKEKSEKHGRNKITPVEKITAVEVSDSGGSVQEPEKSNEHSKNSNPKTVNAEPGMNWGSSDLFGDQNDEEQAGPESEGDAFFNSESESIISQVIICPPTKVANPTSGVEIEPEPMELDNNLYEVGRKHEEIFSNTSIHGNFGVQDDFNSEIRLSRKLGQFTRSAAKEASKKIASLSQTVLPFVLNQNPVRRAFGRESHVSAGEDTQENTLPVLVSTSNEEKLIENDLCFQDSDTDLLAACYPELYENSSDSYKPSGSESSLSEEEYTPRKKKKPLRSVQIGSKSKLSNNQQADTKRDRLKEKAACTLSQDTLAEQVQNHTKKQDWLNMSSTAITLKGHSINEKPSKSYSPSRKVHFDPSKKRKRKTQLFVNESKSTVPEGTYDSSENDILTSPPLALKIQTPTGKTSCYSEDLMQSCGRSKLKHDMTTSKKVLFSSLDESIPAYQPPRQRICDQHNTSRFQDDSGGCLKNISQPGTHHELEILSNRNAQQSSPKRTHPTTSNNSSSLFSTPKSKESKIRKERNSHSPVKSKLNIEVECSESNTLEDSNEQHKRKNHNILMWLSKSVFPFSGSESTSPSNAVFHIPKFPITTQHENSQLHVAKSSHDVQHDISEEKSVSHDLSGVSRLQGFSSDSDSDGFERESVDYSCKSSINSMSLQTAKLKLADPTYAGFLVSPTHAKRQSSHKKKMKNPLLL